MEIIDFELARASDGTVLAMTFVGFISSPPSPDWRAPPAVVRGLVLRLTEDVASRERGSDQRTSRDRGGERPPRELPFVRVDLGPHVPHVHGMK
jgi:hypothetical protein